MSPHVKKIVGGPGTGKTERLIRVVEEELDAGREPGEVAFVSFTRQAAYGARDRAAAKFNLPHDALPWFRTLHSAALRASPEGRRQIMGHRDNKRLCDLLGLAYSVTGDVGPATVGPDGERCFRLTEYARARQIGHRQAWEEQGGPVQLAILDRFVKGLDHFKHDTGMIDFTDMIEEFVTAGRSLPVTVAVIDEAQDLSPLQWQMAARAFADAETIYLAGDDDQAIFKWAGAAVDHFVGAGDETEVLTRSHRIPHAVAEVAERVVSKIRGRRIPKAFTPTDEPGVVKFHAMPDSIDLREGDWLMLARNVYRLDQWRDLAEAQGVLYTLRGAKPYSEKDIRAIQVYGRMREGEAASRGDVDEVASRLEVDAPEDAETLTDLVGDARDPGEWWDAFTGMERRTREYLRICLRRGEDPRKKPRVRIDTIHAAKGAEAPNVALCLDIARRTQESLTMSPDDEMRCLYVGVTRSGGRLDVLMPQTGNHYSEGVYF